MYIIFALLSRIQVAFWETSTWLSWMGSLLISFSKVSTQQPNLSQKVNLEMTNLQQKSHKLIIHQELAQMRRWKKILISKPQTGLIQIPRSNKAKLVSYLSKNWMLLKRVFGEKNQGTPQLSKSMLILPSLLWSHHISSRSLLKRWPRRKQRTKNWLLTSMVKFNGRLSAKLLTISTWMI